MKLIFTSLLTSLMTLSLFGQAKAEEVNIANLNNKVNLLIQEIIANDDVISQFSFEFNPAQTDFLLPTLGTDISATAKSTPWQLDKPSVMTAKIYVDLQKLLQTGEITLRFQSQLKTAQVPMLKFMGAKGLERIANGTATDLEKNFEQTYTKLSTLVAIDKMQTIFTTVATDTIEIWNKQIVELEKQLDYEMQQNPVDEVVIGYLKDQIADLNTSVDSVLLFNFKKVSENGVFQKVVITHPNPADVLAFSGFNIPVLKDFKMEVSDNLWTVDGEMILVDDMNIFGPIYLDNIEDIKLFDKGDEGAKDRLKKNMEKTLTLMKTLMKGEIPSLGPETFFQ